MDMTAGTKAQIDAINLEMQLALADLEDRIRRLGWRGDRALVIVRASSIPKAYLIATNEPSSDLPIVAAILTKDTTSPLGGGEGEGAR